MSDLLGGLVVGALTIVFSVSFAAIVFSGPTGHLLDRGIGTTLLAATALSLGAAAFYSYRAIFAIPQDVSAVLLAGGAAAIAAQGTGLSDDALFATVAVMLGVTALVAGITMVGLGVFKLSNLIRYIPYTVKGGFLAATGYLLTLGSIGLLLGQNVDLWSLPAIVEPTALKVWAPWMAIAVGILIATRLVHSGVVFPLCLLAICAGFYIFLAVSGLGMEGAREAGLLLGPFGTDGFLDEVRPGLIAQADWRLVASQSLTILTVVAMTILGGGLNLSGIEMAVRREFDSDKDFVAMGLSNLLVAPTGGVLGFPGISSTLLGDKFGVRSGLASCVVAAGCLGVAVFGAGILEVLPRGLFAALLGFLGLDLLVTWIWSERRRLVFGDYSIILSILAVAALLGFLQALAFGLVLSAILFIISYSELEFVRRTSDLVVRRSTVEREPAEIEYLQDVGHTVRIFEFTGYLFFGTATRLGALFQEQLESDPAPGTLILDFSRVSGVDPSAVQALAHVSHACHAAGISLILAGASGAVRRKTSRFDLNSSETSADFDTLEEALQHAENRLLAQRETHVTDVDQRSFLDRLVASHPELDLEKLLETITLQPGAHLLRHGGRSDNVYLLKSGRIVVSIPLAEGQEAVIARLQPGALIGEIAHYSDADHSADAIATEPSELFVLDRETLAELGHTHPQFVQSFHALAAMYLARRVRRSTQLLRAVLD